MADFFTAEQIEILSAGTVRCDVLATFYFLSGTMYARNGNTPLVALDGNTYLPMYGYGAIEGLGLGGGTQSTQVTLSLNGLPSQALDYLGKAIEETPDLDQQLMTASLQFFSDEWQPVGVPINLFQGFMQPPTVSRSAGTHDDAGTQSVRLVAENIFYGRSRPPFGRNTDRDQQARSPGDKFFGFVSSLVKKLIRYPDYNT